MNRVLGLDVGSKTIGVAMTDEAGIAAHPLRVLERKGTDTDVSAVQTLVIANDVRDVVIGMPFDLTGRIGHRGKRVQEFISALRKQLPETVELHEQDERFSTAEATRVLLDADLSRARRKQVIDQQAAALILQAWLDRKRSKSQ